MRHPIAVMQRLISWPATLALLLVIGGFPAVSRADMVIPMSAATPYSYRLADNLIRGIDLKVVNGEIESIRGESILPATFVDLTTLEPESVLGRVIAQQVASRFTQRGFRVIEAKVKNRRLAMEDGAGELLLSRRARHLQRAVQAALFLTGTYTVSNKSVFLNAKVIDARDNHVIVSADAEMAIHGNIKELVRMDRGSPKKALTDRP